MNRADMTKEGFKPKTVVNLVGIYNGEIRRAEQFLVVPYDIPQGCVATYFPEANVLVPIDSYAKGSKTPSSKWVAIKIEKA